MSEAPHFPDIGLTVVIPVYNEEAQVEPAVRRSVATLGDLVGAYELLLIDDASTDGSGAVLDALAGELPGVRVVHNPVNLKQGGSLAVGFGEARHELVMHNAIDMPYDLADLPDALAEFPAADVVVITRRTYPGVSRARLFVSWVNRTLIRVLFGARFSDYNFVQIYRRDVLAALDTFSTATAFMTVERIIRAHHAGYRVVAVPADYHPRQHGVSSSGNLRVVLQSLRDMARLRLQLRRRRSLRQPRGDRS